jgi:hypothetical protein
VTKNEYNAQVVLTLQKGVLSFHNRSQSKRYCPFLATEKRSENEEEEG